MEYFVICVPRVGTVAARCVCDIYERLLAPSNNKLIK